MNAKEWKEISRRVPRQREKRNTRGQGKYHVSLTSSRSCRWCSERHGRRCVEILAVPARLDRRFYFGHAYSFNEQRAGPWKWTNWMARGRNADCGDERDCLIRGVHV